MKTNSLPNFDCDFQIVVNNAVAYEVAAIPTSMMEDGVMLCFNNPDMYFKLKKVYDPYTINITALGDITVTKGVTGLLEGSVEEVSEPGVIQVTSPAPPPVITTGPNNDPVIESVDILPKPNPAPLPPGVDATVKKDAYLTLTVKATDPDGDYPLHCKWSSEKVGGGTPWAFAVDVLPGHPMEPRSFLSRGNMVAGTFV